MLHNYLINHIFVYLCLSPPRADCSFNLKELIIHLKVIVLQNVFTPFIVQHVEMIESALPIEEEVLIGGVVLCFFFGFLLWITYVLVNSQSFDTVPCVFVHVCVRTGKGMCVILLVLLQYLSLM